jgi:hypothetical protein
MTSIDTWTRRKDLQEELGLLFQVEEQTTKAVTEATRCEFQTHLKEVEARAERRRGTGIGASAAKPHKLLDFPSSLLEVCSPSCRPDGSRMAAPG